MTGTSETAGYALAPSTGERRRYQLMAEHARTSEAGDWVSAGLAPGATVADVGCGPGAVLRLLAQEVGPRGRVVGVDISPVAVAAATEEVSGLDHASVHTGPATATGLPPGTFDVVMCRHVLAHNGGREQRIVDHLAALARPGGAVYLVDVDAALTWINPADPDLTDMNERYRDFQTMRGNDMYVGRRLGELLEAAGLEVETYRCGGTVMRMPPGIRSPAWAARAALQDVGLATDADLARWDAAMHRTDALPTRPWAGVPLVLAIGRKRR